MRSADDFWPVVLEGGGGGGCAHTHDLVQLPYMVMYRCLSSMWLAGTG